MKIKIIKFSDHVNLPDRAHYNDSGADIFASKTVTIPPHQIVPVATGIGLELPNGYDVVIHCKSGLSSKGILCANAPIDAGYRGEIFAILYNTTNDPVTFFAGDKIGQFVVRPVIYADFVLVIEGEERGDGAFGSTGR